MPSHLLLVTGGAAHDVQLIRANYMSKDLTYIDDSLISEHAARIYKVDELAATVFWVRPNRDVS